MSRQYKRTYSLSLIGEGSTKDIKDLRIAFEITKSIRSYPNKAKIQLYNPNDDTVSLLTSGNPLILLNAGYVGNEGLIFRGRISNIFVNRIAEDRVVTVYAADGVKDWEKAIYNKTLSENVTLESTVNEILKTFNDTGDVTVGTLEGLEGSADKLRGQVLSGSSKDILDMLAEDYDFEWSIQDGEITITKIDEPLTTLEATIIKQSTGMIGSPTITEIGSEVTSLMNPELLPNRAYKIESESAEFSISNLEFRNIRRLTESAAEGLYKAYEVVILGDTHGTQWYSTVRGTFFNG